MLRIIEIGRIFSVKKRDSKVEPIDRATFQYQSFLNK